MLIFLLQGMTFGFAAAVQPGPMQAYLVSEALRRGWRRTLLLSLAPVISDGPIIILTLFVLSSMPAWFEQFLQIAGGLFLFYLAAGTYRTWRHYDEAQANSERSGQAGIFRAATINLLNPNPYLGWMLVMGPILMKAWRAAPGFGITLVVSFYGTMVLCNMVMVVLFSSARRLGPRVTRTLVGVSGVGLALLGCFQVWQGTIARWWA